MKMEFGVAFAPARGEVICGDGCALVEQADAWWACVVDGLGHGPAAADAARAATEYVRTHPDRDLGKLLAEIDASLRPTRGAAVSLVCGDLSTGGVRFAGVGNVELRARTRTPYFPITTAGIVGRGFRKVVISEHRLLPGDLLALTTDGLSSRIDLDLPSNLSSPEAAELLLQKYHRNHDDGLCFVMRALQGEAS